MILVTGGAGFLGSSLVAALNRRGIDNILIVDILGHDQRWENLRRLRYADYMEADDFSHMVAGESIAWEIEAIFHFGACIDPDEADCSYMVKNNFEFSKLLAGWALELEARFIYASCASVYGDGTRGFADNEARTHTFTPLDKVGFSKQMFDLWCYRRGLLDRFVGLRYFDVFGPHEDHKGPMQSLVLKAVDQIRTAGRVQVYKSYHPDYADGQQMRDFVYVTDAVEMTLFFLDNPDIGGLFNIGTGQARSWNDMAKAVFGAMGKPAVIESVEMSETLRGRFPYFMQADIRKLRAAGYAAPTIPLEDAAADYVQHYPAKNDTPNTP